MAVHICKDANRFLPECVGVHLMEDELAWEQAERKRVVGEKDAIIECHVATIARQEREIQRLIERANGVGK